MCAGTNVDSTHGVNLKHVLCKLYHLIIVSVSGRWSHKVGLVHVFLSFLFFDDEYIEENQSTITTSSDDRRGLDEDPASSVRK